MRVVEVIPVVKGITRPTLSYFTKDKFEPGSFVRIPLRSGSTTGIVSASIDARRAKASLKKADFSLRKLSAVPKGNRISPAFMRAAEETANFYAAEIGSVLSALIPKLFLEFPELLGRTYKERSDPPREIKLVQLNDEERFREYRSIVRESFARGESVMFIAPTKEDVKRAESELATGIEQYVYVLGEKSPKVLRKILSEASGERHPILFITTPALIAFDRKDMSTYILERENSRAYRTLARPFLNIKFFLGRYARAKGAQLILGDAVLSLESLWHEREGRYSEFSPLTWRLKTSCEAEVIDMRAKKEFEILSPRLAEALGAALAQKKKVFVYAARKGLSSTTICGDCASLLLCRNCRSPLVLHSGGKKDEANLYICHHCGARRSAETKCDNCESWKLTPLGVGIDRVAEALKETFGDTEIFVLDKDRAGTTAKARAIVKRFEESPSAILVGTELALYHLRSVPLVAAASLDSLFSIADFWINERIFYLITHLRELAAERFILQTRNAGTEILEYAAAGNILDFYRMEIAEREELGYPPFSIFIKVSTEGSPEKLRKKAAELLSSFGDYAPQFVSARETLSMIMRLPRSGWPNADLKERLLLLTPDFTVKVDPESIL